VRMSENPSTMINSVSAALHQVDPSVALAEPKTLDAVVDESMADQRFTLILFASFAAVALFLAALGIYGVMSFSVAQRAHEIALRMALGATRDRVIRLIRPSPSPMEAKSTPSRITGCSECEPAPVCASLPRAGFGS
jgi:putative ABC transport system permease protein